MLANMLKVAPSYEITDGEFLDQAEAEIRHYGRLGVSVIVAIGKKLVEVKERIGHGNYEDFVRRRLPFTSRTARNYVRAYELLKSETISDFDLDAGSLDLLARPSTSNRVRVAALEKARTERISEAEIQKLIADDKAKSAAKAKDEAEKEASGAKAPEKSAALAQSDEWVTEIKDGAAAIAQPVCAEIDTQNEIVLLQDQTSGLEATIKESTSPATEEAVAKAKEPPDPPVDTELSSRAAEARKAIVRCVGAIKLTPEQCIAAETEAGRAQIALGAKSLTLWLKEFNQRYAKKLKGEQLPLPLDDQLPPDDLLPFFTQATADEGHDAVTIKLVSARPRGSQDNQLCKQKRRSADRHRITRGVQDPAIVAEIIR